MANEIIGKRRTPCGDCGQLANIMQARRKGAHLYTRCGCGLEQKTGANFQLKVWRDAEWLGLPPTPPTNIEAKINEPLTDEASGGADSGDFDPTETKPKGKPKKQAKGRGGLVGLGILLATIGGATWASMRNN